MAKFKKLVPNIDIFYEGFDIYMNAKIKQNEAFRAVNGDSKQCMGIAAFQELIIE
ncbi:hypothetical protein G9F72_013545 [Clostridium estertheticum]|uniref:hypothetical protein n=1 Tax=Clostridium estertheticum TaxID=238834 RepID=UPI001CD0CBA9|nr:hypothetical protein [Clostridium estertheticum]MBZ9687351.1 hypothetical protein [Clostridium estertheticum]